MKKGAKISKETLQRISKGLTGIDVDEREWEDILIRMGDLLNNIEALDEMQLSQVQPAFSFNPGEEGE